MTHWSCWAFGGWLILSFMGLILGSHIGKAFTVATWNLFSYIDGRCQKNSLTPIIYKRISTEQGKGTHVDPQSKVGEVPHLQWSHGKVVPDWKNWRQELLYYKCRAYAKPHYHCNIAPGSRSGLGRGEALRPSSATLQVMEAVKSKGASIMSNHIDSCQMANK